MHLKDAVNPTWFTNNQLQDTNGGVYPLPATDWDVNSSGQKLTDWATNPADALAIYDNLNKPTALTRLARSRPARCGRSSTVLQAAELQHDQQLVRAGAEQELRPLAEAELHVRRRTRTPARPRCSTRWSPARSRSVRSIPAPSLARSRRSSATVSACSALPSWGWFGGFFNFKDTTNHFNKVVAQPYMRGVFAELIESVGDRHGRLPRLGRAGLRAGRERAEVAVRPEQRDQGDVARTARRRLLRR